ncbi:hypothetical protein [Oryzibacter oryziterrae]|uniref:hypothetical protein n=1 Tax=Oryzibacter oryziterrae TaxID=2766474 RepID=UPI001F1DFF9C|nr:hypothetical protein [Oryzibacter oryziterrae]
MFKTRRLLGFAAIVASAIVVASGLAAISSPAGAVTRQMDSVPSVSETPATLASAETCNVDISDVAGSDETSPLSVAEHHSVDLDLLEGYGVSVACGTGAGSAATAGFSVETDPNLKADRLPL